MPKDTPTALEARSVPVETGSGYPAPYDQACKDRQKRRLGDLFNLDQFGVNLVELPPGAWSSQRHWHTHEDEFIYVLEGVLTLINDDGETVLTPGMCAGFKAGVENGHHVGNKSDEPVVYLEVGARHEDDDGHYSDIDMQILKRAKGGKFTRKDGTPI